MCNELLTCLSTNAKSSYNKSTLILLFYRKKRQQKKIKSKIGKIEQKINKNYEKIKTLQLNAALRIKLYNNAAYFREQILQTMSM